ncbi:olfactory receptor 11L1-like [Xenopus tropicalis]|uniref:Olfactory receptor n=1 Tax=Xenopus tropicalis TaxID=8364 RepID=A0A8J0SZQ3_XENTR|nr:olfactory receptor 11L1-like [Xenopus tropicalis]|eukprot:XP_017948230.1 PREDICTED: olfactory receptor 11L1-like [Xenopus tropicalis]
MNEKNQTWVSEIVLLGFQNLHNFKVPLFSLFLLIYILTVWENVLIIVLVAFSRNLHSPMYFFLQQLALCDLLNSTVIVPTLLQTVINGGTTVSFIGCITQFSFFSVPEAFECLLLAVMAYDRYVAICIPLRYTSMMAKRTCVEFIVMAWTSGITCALLLSSIISTLQFCNRNTINHFFCDFFPVVELSCSSTFLAQTGAALLSVPMIIFPFILIIVSYMCIAHAILKIVSHTGRQKAFSTCSSHLAVVSIFYGTIIALYMVPPRKESQNICKALSLLYTVVIPSVNPVIYSLRSTDIKEALIRRPTIRLLASARPRIIHKTV